MVHEADLVAQPMREVLAPSCGVNDAACGVVYRGKRDAWSHECLGCLVGRAHGLIHAPLMLGGPGGEERARHEWNGRSNSSSGLGFASGRRLCLHQLDIPKLR